MDLKVLAAELREEASKYLKAADELDPPKQSQGQRRRNSNGRRRRQASRKSS